MVVRYRGEKLYIYIYLYTIYAHIAPRSGGAICPSIYVTARVAIHEFLASKKKSEPNSIYRTPTFEWVAGGLATVDDKARLISTWSGQWVGGIELGNLRVVA